MGFARLHLPFSQQVRILLVIFIIMTVVEVVNALMGRMLNSYGILPRSADHWLGVPLAPFLHGSPAHYASNIVPLLVLSFFAMQHGIWRYLLVTTGVILASGLLVWLFGRPAIHIGASGLIYGYFGFLLVAGFVSREFKLILIAVVVWLLYGSIIYGVLPSLPHISFESHLFGFLTGAFVGYRWGGVRQKL
ncbi:MAG: rhomboid family intramembrane serine protease [Ketobacteraceae bacterium]|nr:rhomboid family intramembrane serine protease [Ketobacteraceae bacterium]